jgi:hypothetical protein
MDTVANAPPDSLYRTVTAGPAGTWSPTCPTARCLQLEAVRFAPENATGWLGDGLRALALYRTLDHGQTWRRAALPPR